jgi:two-component system, chemotaxis family, response regulator Rcp1
VLDQLETRPPRVPMARRPAHMLESGLLWARNLMIQSQTGRPVSILLVEDNPGDIRLTQEALREGCVESELQVARDGVEALDLLRRRGRYADAARPDLILLDLNLPRKDGREVLAALKADDSLRRIPVVVLSTSRADEDIRASYDLHANCYITKPVDLDRFIAVVRSIDQFWLSLVELPSG